MCRCSRASPRPIRWPTGTPRSPRSGSGYLTTCWLKEGQDEALDRLRAVLGEPRRVIDVFGALFARPIDPADAQLLGLATGESYACLNYLMHAGEVERTVDDKGVLWFVLA